MDKLQKIALKYQSIMYKEYYFEIAKKQNLRKFILSFEKADFFHLAGFHKLKDVMALQTEKNKTAIFDKIVKGDIVYTNVENSFFFGNIKNRLMHLENIEKLLDSNQIIFQYLENKNKASLIKADYLMQSTQKEDILFIFLSERNEHDVQDIPTMCCRSFFPMNKVDYSINQPSYTLLKKTKINIMTGEKVVQYDRNKIMQKAKQASSEHERKSVIQQLNEKKAQQSINEIFQKKRELEFKDRTEQER